MLSIAWIGDCQGRPSVLCNKLGERAFSVAAPQAWNRLPTDLKTLRSTPALKRSLKTCLFRAAYNV